LIAGSVAGLVLVFAAACGGGGAATTPGPGSTASTPRPATATRPAGAGGECHEGVADDGTVIEITTNAVPAETRIAVGEKITWTNNDVRTHKISFRGGPDCKFMLIGGSVWIQFDNPGTFDYICQFHETMTGKVTVE
jgi:plastocyanin